MGWDIEKTEDLDEAASPMARMSVAVEAFCAGQAELRARLAHAGRPEGTPAPGDGHGGCDGVAGSPGGRRDGQG